MSSPLGNINPNYFEKALINFHKKAAHNRRVKILAELIYTNFLLPFFTEKKELKVLDFGCGDMQIMHGLKKKMPGATFYGIDVFKLPGHLASDAYWENYRWFDGINIPFDDNYFDVVLLADVLHHVEPGKHLRFLKSIQRVTDFIIIKDHFEFGFFSRQMLRLMDFAGNWAYGVQVPKRYFTKISFALLVTSADCKKIKMIEEIDLYKHLTPLNFFIQDRWQFIYLGKFN